MPEPEGFYTDKNGVTRPITKRKTAGAVIAGAVVAGLMTAAGGGGATASVGAALDSAATSASADAQTADGEAAARKGDDTKAWQRMAMKELKKAIKQRLRCGLQSTGQVQQFFLRTPCVYIDELLLALDDSKDNLIVVSVAWVKMSSKDNAAQLKSLEDTYGSGDITPIATQILGLSGIHFTGSHYASRQDGPLLVVSEAEPVRGHPSMVLLNDAPKLAAVLPPP